MQPLDLTKQPPRSPRVQVGGLVMIARTIDKLRASLPGGNPGSYKMPGFSAEILERLGVSEDALRGVIAKAESEDAVLAWLAAHTDQARYPEINREFSEETSEGYSEKFHASYPAARKYNLSNVFEIMEYDDREMFGIPHPQGEVAPKR
ncbi:MAG: DUF5069 domain-containing protein [Candidatus Eremiobacteraeota bacterium]|nr:DUF5069 domain-containing protein [Candidatus Eremiobacteraeota bacterium]